MPLEEKAIVDIREEMALAAMARGATVTEVAARFGVRRPTVGLWRERYREEGRSGLEDRSHATLSCPHRTDPGVEDLIVEERKRWGWGSKKLLQRLSEAHPGTVFPGRSTGDDILGRRRLCARRTEKRRAKGPGAAAARYKATDPRRHRMSSTVERPGNTVPGCASLSRCNSFFEPHPQRFRSSTIKSSTPGSVRWGQLSVAWERSSNPDRPSSRYRSRHSRTVGRLTPNRAATSVTVAPRAIAAKAISSLMSTIAFSSSGIARPAMTHSAMWKVST